jgi:hypothetical protein
MHRPGAKHGSEHARSAAPDPCNPVTSSLTFTASDAVRAWATASSRRSTRVVSTRLGRFAPRPRVFRRGVYFRIDVSEREDAGAFAFFVEPSVGIEPTTSSLPMTCSTTELQGRCRTRYWSGWRESNPRLLLGRQGHYHYATPAVTLGREGFEPPYCMQNGFTVRRL